MYKTLPQMIYKKSQDFPELNIQFSKNAEGTFLPVTYKDFVNTMLDFSSGLLAIGEKEYSNIGLICDNRKEWLVCSMGIMATKSRDIPRGSEATIKDLSYILSFAECKTVVTENKILFNRILECKEGIPTLQNIIIINPSDVDFNNPATTGLNIFSYDEILAKGKDFRQNNPNKIEEIMLSGEEEDSATIIFTSGTTGKSKGVVLSNDNLNAASAQCETCGYDFQRQHSWLNIMPPFIVYGVGNGLHLPLAMYCQQQPLHYIKHRGRKWNLLHSALYLNCDCRR